MAHLMTTRQLIEFYVNMKVRYVRKANFLKPNFNRTCINKYGNNVEFLWRIAKACRMVGQNFSDNTKEKEFAYKGMCY